MAGRYRVVRQLGRGGMGVVWRAVDDVLGREVAVKELRTYSDASGAELADLRLRMQREARAAARVRHPGVVAVHDVTEHEGRPVIVMELVDGPSLDDVLSERGVMDPREAAAIGARVLEALAAAHGVGVLHRDVKPGNVLLDRTGRVVLTDFGIAAMDDPGDGSATHLTRSGEIVGSLDYLAPERAQGHEPGPASDVWALGATLYAAVEGSSPFRRTSTWSTLSAIVDEPLPEPHRAGPLAPVLRALMHKDPAQRPDATTAARLLTEVAAGQETSATLGLGGAAHSAAPGAARGGDTGSATADGLSPVAPPVAPGAGGDTRGSGPAPTARNEVPYRPQGFGPAPAGAHEAGQPAGGAGAPYGAQFAQGHGPVPGGHPAAYGAGPAEGGRTPQASGGAGGSGTGPVPGGGSAHGPGRGRGKALVAAAVAAVLLAGGGVTYALVGRDQAPGDKAAGAADPAPSRTRSGDVLEPGGVPSPSAGSGSPSASGKGDAKESATPSRKPPAAGAGGAGDTGDGKSGGADGGASGSGSSSGSGSGYGSGSGGSTGGATDTGGSTSGGATTSGGGGDPAPVPSCHSIGGGKSNCEVWRTATSYSHGGNEMGVLYAGTNYFYCQVNLGRRETHGQWTNVWWARTDDDSGNTNVYVNVVNLKGGDNDAPLPGLPIC
ncbi:protein kinase [Streptomyces sp. NPDC000410]|uniref:serine/threonine-protein kinase n=1 Tax=Streptomyces sp. NPDC000410 TaxID=3154254 RepID=UPI003321C7E9